MEDMIEEVCFKKNNTEQVLAIGVALYQHK